MERLHRKHSTVMNADVAGYSRLMAQDEEGTLDALLECLDRIAELVDRFGGRVVDAPGDNMLAEFPCELDALRCALEVQRDMLARRRTARRVKALLFRIGLHHGQLLEKGERLYGDVVNLAARLQSAARPGGIMMSDAVARCAGSAADARPSDRGRQYFKNIPYAVQTYELGPA